MRHQRFHDDPPDIPWPLLALLLIVPLYALPNFANNTDGLEYAHLIEEASEWRQLPHPHHLGYAFGGALIDHALTAIGWELHALSILTTLSRLGAIGCLVQLWLLGRAWGFRTGWIAALLMLFGSSFTVWSYGTDAALYLPTLFLVLWLHRSVMRWEAAGPSTRQLVGAGAILLVAVMVHQLVVLLIPALAAWTLWRARCDRQKVMPLAGRLAGAWIAPSVVAYLAATLFAFGLPLSALSKWAFYEHLMGWSTRYAHMGQFWIWNRDTQGLALPEFWARLIASSQARVFWATPWDPPYGDYWGAEVAEPWARGWQGAWTERSYWELLPLLLIGGLVIALKGARVLWREGGESRDHLCLSLAFGLPILAFTLLFEPQNSFYRLYYLIPGLHLLLTGAARGAFTLAGQGFLRGALAVFLTFTLLTNVAYGWLPRGRPAINPWRAGASEFASLSPGPILVIRRVDLDSYVGAINARAFGGRTEYDCRALTLEAFAADGGKHGTLDEEVARSESLLGGPWEALYCSEELTERIASLTARGQVVLECKTQLPGPGEPKVFWVDLRELALAEPRQFGPYALSAAQLAVPENAVASLSR